MGRYTIITLATAFGATHLTPALGDESGPQESAANPTVETAPSEVPGAVPTAINESAIEEEAKVQFETGREFFNQGRFEEAAIAMKRAFELRPSYKILYYLGWAESETGNFSRALNAYTGYLAEAPPDAEADRISEVQKEVEKLRARVGSVQIRCTVQGAKIKVDNEVLGVTPLDRPISVDVGKHEVTVVDGGNILLTEIIRIAGGQKITLEVGADAATVVAAPAPGTDLPISSDHDTNAAPKPRNKGRIAAFAGFGLTAALAVAAGVTGALALDKSNEIWDKCDNEGNCYSEDYNGDFESDQGSLRTLGVTTDVLIGVASAAAIASVVLLVVSRDKHGEKTAHTRLPSIGASPLGFSVSGRF